MKIDNANIFEVWLEISKDANAQSGDNNIRFAFISFCENVSLKVLIVKIQDVRNFTTKFSFKPQTIQNNTKSFWDKENPQQNFCLTSLQVNKASTFQYRTV